MMTKLVLFYGLGILLIHHTIGFSFIDNPKAHPNNNPHIGRMLTLMSTSTSPHETCIWKHNNKTCRFDWNKRHNRVSSERCEGYGNRVLFRGVYPAQECTIEIEKVELSDTGKWTCEMINKRGQNITRDIWIKVIETAHHSKKSSNTSEGITQDQTNLTVTSSSESSKNTTEPASSTIETSTELGSSNINKTNVTNNEATKSGKYTSYH